MAKLLLSLILLCSPAFGAFTRIAHVKQTVSGVASSAIDTTGANLIVIVAAFQTGTTDTMVDSNSNTYTQATTQVVGGQITVSIWYVVSPTVGSGHTFQCNGASNFCSIYVAAYAGAATSSTVELTGGTTNTGSTIAPGSLTPTCTAELAVTGLATEDTTAPTVSSATLSDSNGISSGVSWGGGLADTIQTTAAAFNPTWNLSGSVINAAASVTFKAASGVCPNTAVKHRVIGGL